MVAFKWSAQQGNVQEKLTTDGALKVFDRMHSPLPVVVLQEEVPNRILVVSIHEVIYPMTKEVLHLVFDPYGGEKGVIMMVFERIDHVMALVSFPSPHEATKAREALHGRNIYDGCCRMDIKYSAPLPVSNTSVTASTPTAPQPAPCSVSTLEGVDSDKKGDAAMVFPGASPVHHSVALAVAAISQKCPVMPKEIDANQVSDRLLSASDDKEHVQVKRVPSARTVEINTDMSAEVLTQIGGLSLFQELPTDTSDAMAEMLPGCMVCDDETADQVLTHVGSFSLFIEIDLDTHHELEGDIDKPTCLEHAIEGVGHVFLVLPSEEGMLQELPLKQMQQQVKINNLPWDTTKQEVEIKGLFNLGNSEQPNMGRIPPWRCSAFSPRLRNTMRVILGQPEGICISCSRIQLLIVRERLWDPGILVICECNLFISRSGPFVQHFEKNTPADNMQMDFILLLAQDILRILVLLHGALLLVLLNDKDNKLEQAVHRNLFVCARKSTIPTCQDTRGYQILFLLLNSVRQYFGPTSSLSVQATFVFMIARREHWESENCRFHKKYRNPLLQPMGILQWVHDQEVQIHTSVAIGHRTNAYVQLTEVATYFQSQAGNPLVFLSACRCWHLDSLSSDSFYIIWLLQVHAELYM
jgi:hypothetical protein